MKTGNIGVTTDNIFPVIKKFLYSDQEIFLREIVSNAVDATQKLKTLSSMGTFQGETGDLAVRVKIDAEAKTLTVSDRGIGMTADEIDRYINQIAFSGAEEFLEKYKNDANAIIGHFGLGFYSSFMVSNRVDIVTKSWQEGAQAVKWSCDGSPAFTLEDIDKDDRGTDIIMHISDDFAEFLKEDKINGMLKKYCRFLPVPVIFGKKKEWKKDKYEETDEDNQINETKPAWTNKPSDMQEEDYNKFYHELYPFADDPLFHIHLNVDYPFNLTGILYFPKIKNRLELQKNKIQLYCNQVFVTDSVEGIVPDFLTLLHGVIDSPDIPLNVSRSYLQSDSNVKKISNHITKKVGDSLQKIFNDDRKQFEGKWNDLKIFIEYGILTEEKFWEKAEKFVLLQQTDGKFYTLEEYKTLVSGTQTDKDGQMICLYATDREAQYAYIEAAKNKGYDVLLMDGDLDVPFMQHVETKWEKTRFVRVDSDTVDNLIAKDDKASVTLSQDEQDRLKKAFSDRLPEVKGANFYVSIEALGQESAPIVLTQNEFMRRMKDMSALQAGMSFYGDMPSSFNMVLNSDHPLMLKVLAALPAFTLKEVEETPSDATAEEGREAPEKKEPEKLLAVDEPTATLINEMTDLALLTNNMLKGAALSVFVKRSFGLL